MELTILSYNIWSTEFIYKSLNKDRECDICDDAYDVCEYLVKRCEPASVNTSCKCQTETKQARNKRYEKIIDVITHNNIDICLLQEVEPHFIKLLKKKAPEYSFVVADTCITKYYKDYWDNLEGKGTTTAVVWNNSNLKINNKYLICSDDKHKYGGKSAVIVELTNVNSNIKMIICSFHLPGQNTGDENIRALRLLNDINNKINDILIAGTVSKAYSCAIMGGDANMNEFEYYLKQLSQELPLWKIFGRGNTTPTVCDFDYKEDSQDISRTKIDWIAGKSIDTDINEISYFVPTSICDKYTETKEMYLDFQDDLLNEPSDHLPVLLEISILPKSPKSKKKTKRKRKKRKTKRKRKKRKTKRKKIV
tara:strand:- start:133 stop:1227 length:1095 start_codon:yes stop_codon:yes gene_type:complete